LARIDASDRLPSANSALVVHVLSPFEFAYPDDHAIRKDNNGRPEEVDFSTIRQSKRSTEIDPDVFFDDKYVANATVYLWLRRHHHTVDVVALTTAMSSESPKPGGQIRSTTALISLFERYLERVFIDGSAASVTEVCLSGSDSPEGLKERVAAQLDFTCADAIRRADGGALLPYRFVYLLARAGDRTVGDAARETLEARFDPRTQIFRLSSEWGREPELTQLEPRRPADLAATLQLALALDYQSIAQEMTGLDPAAIAEMDQAALKDQLKFKHD